MASMFGAQRKKSHNYRTEKIAKGNIVKTISANGTLNPVVLVNVGTQISGVINKLNVDFNDRVHKDQVLAEIDPSLIDAQLEQSRASSCQCAGLAQTCPGQRNKV